MRQSSIRLDIQTDLDKEAELLQTIVNFLSAQKNDGNVNKATISTQEIEVPTIIEI